MNKAIKYRLYPTTEQKIMFAKTFGCCRKVYNLMLADKIESYKLTGKFATVTPAKYKSDYPYLKEVDSLALCNKQMDLQEAFSNRFKKSRKKKNGFPKFKSAKHSRRSYTTNNQNGTVALFDNTIKLPKIGKVKIVVHKKPESDWVIKSATISQESDNNYYVSVLFEFDNRVNNHVIDINNAIGLDYASNGLYVDSNGNIGSNHKFYRESHRKLAKVQRRLSRMIEHNISGYKIVGKKRCPIYKRPLEECKNIQKQKVKVARIHRHIANQRLDNLHKLSTEIANQYDIVCIESLNMKNMSNRGFGNGKATMDNGFGIFVDFLDYKLFDRGKLLIKVDKWYPSSQLCNCCGYQNPLLKDLSIRKWQCPVCGVHHDRDTNAAKNILQEGLRMIMETNVA